MLNEELRKKALRLLHHNVAVVSSGPTDNTLAATVTWFMQTSFDPLLLTLALRADSQLYRQVRETARLVINFVADGDEETAAYFFQARTFAGERLGELEADLHPQGGAILHRTPAWLAGKVVQTIERGDHHLVMVEIDDLGMKTESPTIMNLSDTNWHYGG